MKCTKNTHGAAIPDKQRYRIGMDILQGRFVFDPIVTACSAPKTCSVWKWMLKCVAVAMLFALVTVGSGQAHSIHPNQPRAAQPLREATIQLLRHAIAALETRRGASDPQYYADGEWHSAGDDGLWDYSVGPGAAAAVLWRATGEHDRHLLTLAEATFDEAIAAHRLPNGSFGPGADAQPGAQSPGIATIWFGTELGTTYLELAPRLDATRRARWREALTGAADYLVRAGDSSWYINGNDNLAEATVFYLAWRASGNPIYRDDYNTELAFTLHPNQTQWPGFGLHLLAGTAATASGATVGAAGYLSEDGECIGIACSTVISDAPGYDPYYTEVQLDTAVRLYVISGDPRALRLSDLLINMELRRVNKEWYLNTSDGTRHFQSGTEVPFLTSALAVLSEIGARPNLAGPAARQFKLINQHYRATADYAPPDYMGLSDEVAVILQASLIAPRETGGTSAHKA